MSVSVALPVYSMSAVTPRFQLPSPVSGRCVPYALGRLPPYPLCCVLEVERANGTTVKLESRQRGKLLPACAFICTIGHMSKRHYPKVGSVPYPMLKEKHTYKVQWH